MVARTEDEAEGIVADGAGLGDEDEDEDEGVVSGRDMKLTEKMIYSVSFVTASGLTVSLARVGVEQDFEDAMEEGTVERADFEERLAVGAEAMGEGVRFGPENILPRRDLRGGDASD